LPLAFISQLRQLYYNEASGLRSVSAFVKWLFFKLKIRAADQQYGGEPIKNARKVYDSHMELCKRVIPTDKLLIHRPEDGWKPLCDFLGV
jgi:hypothetical protein